MTQQTEKLEHTGKVVHQVARWGLPAAERTIVLSAPHACIDPACPGAANQARLAAAEEMAKALRLLTDSNHSGQDSARTWIGWHRTGPTAFEREEQGRAALTAWEEAG